MKNFKCWLLLMIPVLISSCTGLRYSSREDPLYAGPDIKVSQDGLSRARQKELERGIRTGIRPRPNGTFLGFMRPRLSIHNMAGKKEPKKNSFRYWLKYQVGEPPVKLKDINVPLTETLVREYVVDNGHFNSAVTSEVKKRGKTAAVIYNVTPGPEYIIRELRYPRGDSLIQRIIAANAPKALVRKGQGYRLDVLKAERIRIDSSLKNEGFFYFQPDYILFSADTNLPGNFVDLNVSLKEDMPSDAERQMTIDQVYVNSDFTFEGDTAMNTMDTVMTDNVHVLMDERFVIEPSVLSRAVAFRPGGLYNRKKHDMTLGRLTSLGLFKFVNVSFRESDSAFYNNRLTCDIRLTPLQKRTVRLEVLGVSKSNNFAGPRLSLAYRDRNFFRRAELFQFNINASMQTQISSEVQRFNSYELSSDAKLFFPRIVAPFAKVKESSVYTPHTRLGVGTGIFNRVGFYSLSSINGVYGYLWRESEYKSHELNPVVINYLDLTNRTDKFEELLQRNLLLRSSFEEQFIVGSSYNFVYSMLTNRLPYNYFYMANIDLSGNTLSLIERMSGRDPLSFTGIPYAQFIRLENDGRYYYDLVRNVKFAGRVIAGIGVPFGNSRTLPYVKQFFSGGANSIRAFAPRSVGPGSFISNDEDFSGYGEQGGEMKLEGSAELRFSLTRFIKPAVFIDAGNVWLVKDNPSIPGGKFDPSSFMQQLAIGAGAGLRIDVSILVLRFDLAFPLQKPFQQHIVQNQPGSLASERRNRNYMLNVALGYPF